MFLLVGRNFNILCLFYGILMESLLTFEKKSLTIELYFLGRAKKMKRIFSCFLILMLLVGMLAGCGSSEKPQGAEANKQTVQTDQQKGNDKKEPEDTYAAPTMPEFPVATLQVECPFTRQIAEVTYNSFFFEKTPETHINYWENPYNVQVNFGVVDSDPEGEILVALEEYVYEGIIEDEAEAERVSTILSEFHSWSAAGDVDVFYVGFVADCDAEGLRKQFIADNIQFYGYTPIETVEVGEKTLYKFNSYRHDSQREYDSYYVYEFDGNVLFMTLHSFMENGALIFSDMFLVDVNVGVG